MDWSKLLIDLRKKIILSQKEMADLLDVSFASINRWENCHHEPTIKIKRKIKKLCAENNLCFEQYEKGDNK